MCNQDKTPLLDAITEFIETKPAYFRIPGHRLEHGISSKWTDKVGKEVFAYDVTETPFTDDLHSPEGAIEEAQELLSELYHADKSFFLVNGTTCGNEAMLLSAAFEGQEVMIARNAHKSAMMGLIMSGAKPVYVMPEILDEWGLQGGITSKQVRRTFEEHPKCRALFLVSPSYYGITSDLKAIADVCHEYGALLLVDEAHGVGVFGRDGRGVCDHFGLTDEVDLIMGTFSKSFASLGGFVAADSDTINWIRHTCRSYIFQASCTPASAAAALEALHIFQNEPERQENLWKITNYALKQFKEAGFEIGDTESPIIPLYVRDAAKTFEVTKLAFDKGVFINPVIPPACAPQDTLVRVALMATHTREQVDRCVSILVDSFKEAGVLK